MNKITGIIIEAGYHLDAAGTIPGVTIEAHSHQELQGLDGPLYRRRVAIVDETELYETVLELRELRAWKRQLETARAAADRAAASASAAWLAASDGATRSAAWSEAAAAQLADVVRVLKRIDEADEAGKEQK